MVGRPGVTVTETMREGPRLAQGMARTVDELRNEIRLAVGRFERIESTAFTKETLAAVCDAVDADVDTGQSPAKSRMRAAILRRIDRAGDDSPTEGDRPFRKDDLEAIADALGIE